MRTRIFLGCSCLIVLAALLGCRGPVTCLPDGPIELIGHTVPLFADEVKAIETEIEKSKATEAVGPPIEIQASLVSLSVRDMKLVSDLPTEVTVLSVTDPRALLATTAAGSCHSMVVRGSYVKLRSGERKVRSLISFCCGKQILRKMRFRDLTKNDASLSSG